MRRQRYRFPSAAIILALVLAAVMSVMAFNRSQITNGAEVTIVTTGQASLAVIPVDPVYADDTSNHLVLTFPNQQPNSTYTYTSVFKVQNNTSATVTLTVAGVTGESTPGAHITLQDAGTSVVYWQNGSAVGSRTLTSMQAATMNVTISLDNGTPIGAQTSLTITVNAQ